MVGVQWGVRDRVRMERGVEQGKGKHHECYFLRPLLVSSGYYIDGFSLCEFGTHYSVSWRRVVDR